MTRSTEFYDWSVPDGDNRPRISEVSEAFDAADASLKAEEAARQAADQSAIATANAYAEALIATRPTKDPVRVVATSAVALTGLQTIDGVALLDGDRVLRAASPPDALNGFYAAHAGAWARTSDADTSAEMKPGLVVQVTEGQNNADTTWTLRTNAPVVLGTTALDFGPSSSGVQLVEVTSNFTASFTATPNSIHKVDTTSNDVTMTLPAAPPDKTQIFVKHVIQGTVSATNTASLNKVTVARGGSDVFNRTGGPTSFDLPLLNQAVTLQYRASGGIWTVLSDDLPLTQLDARYPKTVTQPGLRGTNLSGLMFTPEIVQNSTPNLVGPPSTAQANPLGGVYYLTPQSDFDYFTKAGLSLFRLGFQWERIQPTLNGALDATYLGYLQTMIGYAKAASPNNRVVLDCHNFGFRYMPTTVTDAVITNGSDTITSASNPFTSGMAALQVVGPGIPNNTVVIYNSAGQIKMKNVITGAAVQATASTNPATITVYTKYQIDATPSVLNSYHLANLWYRLAQVFASDPTVLAYDIMNEPYFLPTRNGYPYQESTTLNKVTQVCINAIRAVDSQHWIAVPMMGQIEEFVGWYGSDPSPWWSDPAGKTMVTGHTYLGANHDASYNSPWIQAIDDRLSSDMTPAFSWAQKRGIPFLVGEVGVPSRNITGMNADGQDVARWNSTFDKFMQICDQYGVYVTQWSAGSFYFSPTSMQPTAGHNGSEPTDYTDIPEQLKIMKKYPGPKVVSLDNGGTEQGRLQRWFPGKQDWIQVQSRKIDATDWTYGLIIRPERTFAFDTEFIVGRWLSFYDPTYTTEFMRIDRNGTTTFMPTLTRFGNATNAAIRGESATLLSVRNGSNTGNYANMQAASFAPKESFITPSSGVVTLDCTSASIFYINMNANVTSWAFSNATVNTEYEVHWIQDSTGGRTRAGANGLIRPVGGSFASLTATASKRDIEKYRLVSGGVYVQTVPTAANVG